MSFNMTAIMKLVGPGGSVVQHFQLRVDRVVHSIGRNPVVFAIPGVQDPEGTGLPKTFSLDFGMLTETLILTGILPDNEMMGGSFNPDDDPVFPNHHELATAARTWWKFSFESTDFDTLTNYNKLRLEEGPGHDFSVYGVIIQGLQCDRTGGQTHWNYKLTLAVVDFPPRVVE